ncbi:type VII secretion system-associated protein [Actinokineospora cianjurensis]|uniref:Type III secretion system (T3SS) SseB-like protein n=1 Tax=Actinokineospora cianjurensis TaxID=585224 RepID=A0A421B5U4_9PSEU|nr:type VII secretion system-associated protein [Actinokineospora cianjurensis]RLK59618.1 hypothetical protein CLV68_0099 [Actinokineospora cianjurensis]
MSTPHRPPITAALRAEARSAPNSWLPVVAEDGQVAGRYLVDDNGDITSEFVPNPRYRPRWAPAITPDMRSYALSHPGGWVEVLDPSHPGPDTPEWAVVGRYPVDTWGGIIAEFQANPQYRPSPVALGWPEPRSEAEAVLQLAHTGQIEYREAVIAVLAATLVLPADPTRPPRTRLVLRDRVVDAFVTDDAVPPDWPQHWQKFSGVEIAILIDRLADQAGGPPDLLLHAAPDLQVRIPGPVLIEALRLVAG